MRAIFSVVAVVLIGLSPAASAECFGKYPHMTCVSNSGSVWTPQGYYGGYSNRSGYSDKSDGAKIARYPNSGAGQADQAAAPSGKTEVLQPSAQSGNAWVVTPATSNGATVLGGTCGAGATCP
jgi:hypothetical protein